MTGDPFNIPTPILAAIVSVTLTALIGAVLRVSTKLSDALKRIAILENDRVHADTNRKNEQERNEDLWERLEKHISGMESRLQNQIKEISVDMKALVKEMHSEFMLCPNHHRLNGSSTKG